MLEAINISSKKTAYIAGKIKGLPLEAAKAKFNKKANALNAQGFCAVNPFEYIELHNTNRVADGLEPLTDENPIYRKEILKHCIGLMVICDELHLLHDWQDSYGAWMERDIAQRMGKTIVYP